MFYDGGVMMSKGFHFITGSSTASKQLKKRISEEAQFKQGCNKWKTNCVGHDYCKCKQIKNRYIIWKGNEHIADKLTGGKSPVLEYIINLVIVV